MPAQGHSAEEPVNDAPSKTSAPGSIAVSTANGAPAATSSEAATEDAQAANDQAGSELHPRPASTGPETPDAAGGTAAAAAEQDKDAAGHSAAGMSVEPDVALLPSSPSPMSVSADSAAAGASAELREASEDVNMAVGQEERDQPPAKRAAVATDKAMTDADRGQTESPADAMN